MKNTIERSDTTRDGRRRCAHLSALLVVTALCFVVGSTRECTAETLPVNRPEVTDSYSLMTKLSHPDGNIRVVDFWATWCSPCQKQFPVLSSLHDKYGKRGVIVMSVSLDSPMKDVTRLIKKYGIEYPVYLGDEELAYDYKIKALPTTLIYNGKGKMVQNHTGFVNRAVLDSIIDGMLKPEQGAQ